MCVKTGMVASEDTWRRWVECYKTGQDPVLGPGQPSLCLILAATQRQHNLSDFQKPNVTSLKTSRFRPEPKLLFLNVTLYLQFGLAE